MEQTNKTAIVTGGSHNIGQGIAITLAKYGYDVAISYHGRLEGAQDTKRAIEALGRKCFIYQANLEEKDGPQKLVDAAYADLGHIDVMVCNAGRDGRISVLTATADDLDHLYANDYRNYMLCTGAAARYMVKDHIAGSIILITSSRGDRAYPDDFIYGGFKAAMKRSCESIALDLSAYNIRVNCVAPGAVWPEDKMAGCNEWPFVKNSIPMHRSGTPKDMGEAVAYLADNEKSGYVTGISLRVDGGLILSGMQEGQEEIVWVRPAFREKERAFMEEYVKQFADKEDQ